MKKEMLINVLQPEECRIAIVEDGVLEELYVERSSQESYVGNIYKGRIVNIEPSIQAAFVDFGIGRNGFLHVSDVDPAYYKHLLSKADLAEYEAEMNREYGPGGGGGRDRGGRVRGRGRDRDKPQPMTSWLEPQPSLPVEGEVVDEFSAGISEELPATESFAEEVVEAGEIIHKAPGEVSENTAGEAADEGDFASGLLSDTSEPHAVQPPPLPRPRRADPPTRRPGVPPLPIAEDDDFGAGIVDEAVAGGPRSSGVFTEPDPPFAGAETPQIDDDEEGEPKRKARTRKPKGKSEDAEAEAKPRARRGRKKVDGDTDTENQPEDKPKFMGGAERRTSADDEPEIAPFFEDGGSFNPDAPNDRFIESPTDEAPNGGPFSADPETAEAAEDEAREEARGSEIYESPMEGEPSAATSVGRGFNDDFEDSRPPRRERRERGERGERRGRGRDRDRMGRDRGPRGGNGGFKGGRDRGLPKPKIEEIFKRGQEVLVQVIKEAVGTKGPTLSTYISIAGRYLVLMPSLNRVGVSRKIEDHDARRRLRDIMATLTPPKGVGFIVRTAAIDRDARELRNDLAYLLRLWQVVVKRIKRVSGPVEIYRESDMITRTIRDIFTNDIDTIWVDEPTAFAHASEFLQIVMPKFASRIRYFESTEPLFHRYCVEEEIAKIHQKRIEMPLGGSLVIEQTEALVAIDVNSGNFRADNNAEETAFQMNLHAAKEIARQLRLRDLGGVIVNDFIDMRSESHRRKVEDALREALRRDRARTKILRISQFGIIEMTRQRIRPSLKRSIFSDCLHCRGGGFVKTSESMSIDAMRLLQLAAHRAPAIATAQVGVHPDVAHYLLNKRRKEIAALEERGKLEIQITGQLGVSPETLTVRCFDHNGNEVRLLPPAPLPRLSAGRTGGGRGRDRERGGRERDRGRDRSDREERGSRYPQALD
jgi:ribonuclease E